MIRKKRIALTGPTGLVGTNIKNILSEKYDIYPIYSVETNLTDYNETFKAINAMRSAGFYPDFIIHAAGKVGGIKANIDSNYDFLNDNVLMGLNLIRACKTFGIQNIINLGSTCMYPIHLPQPFKESYIFAGSMEETNEGYAIAKSTVAKACVLCNKQNGTSYKTIVPCNLYGKHDRFDSNKSHLIPAIIKKVSAIKHKETNNIEIWGTGTPRREVLNVRDLVDFLDFSIENWEKIPDIINVSPGVDYSIFELYQKIGNALGVTLDKSNVNFDKTKPDGVKSKLSDTSLIKNLGWKPKVSLEEGSLEVYNHHFLK